MNTVHYEWLMAPSHQELRRIEYLLNQLTRKELSISFQLFADVTNKQNGAIMLARTSSGTIVGLNTIVIVQTLSEQFAHIGDVVVDESHRGQHIAENLMKQLHDFARMEGAEFLQLRRDQRRTAAVALYEKLGYKSIDGYLRLYLTKP